MDRNRLACLLALAFLLPLFSACPGGSQANRAASGAQQAGGAGNRSKNKPAVASGTFAENTTGYVLYDPSKLLQDQCDEMKAKSSMPDAIRQQMERQMKGITASHVFDNVVVADMDAPRFALPTATGELVSVDTALQNGPVIVIFFRGGWCPYDNLQLQSMNAYFPQFTSQGAQIIAVTAEKPEQFAKEASQLGKLNFPVCFDSNFKVEEQYHTTYTPTPQLTQNYRDLGLDFSTVYGTEEPQLTLPAIYLLYPNGKVWSHWLELDYTQRIGPLVVLDALHNLNFDIEWHKEHPEEKNRPGKGPEGEGAAGSADKKPGPGTAQTSERGQ